MKSTENDDPVVNLARGVERNADELDLTEVKAFLDFCYSLGLILSSPFNYVLPIAHIETELVPFSGDFWMTLYTSD